VRRLCSVDRIPSASNRLVKMGMVSSAARMPFPVATSVSATLGKSWLIIRILRPCFLVVSALIRARHSVVALTERQAGPQLQVVTEFAASG